MKISKRWALPAAGMLLAVGATATVGSSSADTLVQFPGDRVMLELGADGVPQVARYDAAGNAVMVIDLQVSKRCQITNLHSGTQPVDLLLDISVNGSDATPVYLVENGLGTGASAGCKTGNGRIGDGQSITLAAGSLLTAEGVSFVSTTVNIEGKFGADLDWSTDTSTAPTRVNLAHASDNGADSGNADNDLVTIAPATPFTALSLAPYSADGRGQIAVDTGGDGGVATRTVFQLGKGYEYSVDCSDQNTVGEAAPAEVDSIEGVEFMRLPNGPKTPGCDELIGVTIDFAADEIPENGQLRDVAIIDHTTTGASGASQDVRARVTITWVVDRLDLGGNPRSQADIDLELEREVIYDGVTSLPVTHCTSYTVGAPAVPAGEANLYDPANPGDAGHPSDQPWCLLSDSRIVSGDTIVQVQVLDVYGDPKFY